MLRLWEGYRHSENKRWEVWEVTGSYDRGKSYYTLVIIEYAFL